MTKAKPQTPAILALKDAAAPSVFRPANLLREGRRQRGLPPGDVPATCLLDPDGDMVRYLRRTGQAKPVPQWACYHTEMWRFLWNGTEFGIVGCAVGAPFAVLVAEQLFASGCTFLVSITSSGQILPVADPPYFILIDKALRDEGTSYHYLPPGTYSPIAPEVLRRLAPLLDDPLLDLYRGPTWTTDAPFRETEQAIAAHRDDGIYAVEMEAAALYAFAIACAQPVACFAHVTNTMAQSPGDFEKGEADGATAALNLAAAAAMAFRQALPVPRPPTRKGRALPHIDAILDLVPDARDGLSRIDRVVLWQLHKLQRQWPDRSVPTAVLYGHVIEQGLNITPEELGLILARLGGQGG